MEQEFPGAKKIKKLISGGPRLFRTREYANDDKAKKIDAMISVRRTYILFSATLRLFSVRKGAFVNFLDTIKIEIFQ